MKLLRIDIQNLLNVLQLISASKTFYAFGKHDRMITYVILKYVNIKTSFQSSVKQVRHISCGYNDRCINNWSANAQVSEYGPPAKVNNRHSSARPRSHIWWDIILRSFYVCSNITDIGRRQTNTYTAFSQFLPAAMRRNLIGSKKLILRKLSSRMPFTIVCVTAHVERRKVNTSMYHSA